MHTKPKPRRIALAASGVVALLLGGVSLAAGAGETTLASLQNAYEKGLQKIQKDYKAAEASWPTRYQDLLEATAAQLQQAGDLENLLALRKEKERFVAQRSVPESPAPGTASLVASLQDNHRKNLADALLEKNRRIVALTEQYLMRLDTLKQELTRANRISEALTVKAEADRIRQFEVYTAARFALDEHETRSAVTPSPSPSEGTSHCPDCRGTGKTTQLCGGCAGSGRCRSCNGLGQRRGLRGSSVLIGCVTCKVTGKCRECGGTGYAVAPCLTCQGKGRVPESVAPVSPRSAAEHPPKTVTAAPSGPPPHREPPPIPTPPVADMARWQALAEQGQAETVDFAAVLRNPEAYRGRILKSRVYLVGASPRLVRVVASVEDLNRPGQALIPYSIEVGSRAEVLRLDIRPRDPVWIVYGVVHPENFTLFHMAQTP